MKTNAFANKVKWTDKRLRPKKKYDRKNKKIYKGNYKAAEDLLGAINTNEGKLIKA